MERKDGSDVVTGRAAGGIARREKLSPERRREIARMGAEARKKKIESGALPNAIKEGSVKGLNLRCAVLEDGRRVLTQSDVMVGLGRARQVKGRAYFDADTTLPAFLQAKNLKPFISDNLRLTSSQIEFITTQGGVAFGFLADMLPAHLLASGSLPKA